MELLKTPRSGTTAHHWGRQNGKARTSVTSSHSSSQSWPCPHPATSAGHVWDKREQHPGTEPPAGPSFPAIITQRGASRTSWRGPGVGDRVPSSATVAAQPDSRNLLARGHLWVSGKSLSSSSGTDIQPQDRRQCTPCGRRPAPRLACHPARAASPQPTNGAAETISLAGLGSADPANTEPS